MPPAAPVELRPVVTEVELHLPPTQEPGDLPGLVAVRRGERLSLREVRRTLDRFMRTGRFADAVARQYPTAGGVKVTFELTAKQHVESLGVSGNQAISTSDVLQATRLADGQEYYPERLRTAVEGVTQLYRSRGYESAEVSVDVAELGLGLDLLFRVVEGPPTRIASLAISGSPGVPVQRLLNATGLTVRGVLDRGKLDRGLERLKEIYRQERFYRAQIAEPVLIPGPDGSAVMIPISAGPRYTFHFHHNRSFGDGFLREVLRYDGTETLDADVIARLVRRLEGFYRFHGFHDVRIATTETVRPDDAQAVLAFEIEEGPQLYVTELRFLGNQTYSENELRERVEAEILKRQPVRPGETKPTDDPLDTEGRTAPRLGAGSADPEPINVLLEDAYQDAAASITQGYRERGHRQAKVVFEGADVDYARGTASARFRISEGPRAVVRQVTFQGGPTGFREPALKLDPGTPLSDSAIEQARQVVLRVLGKDGYLFARVVVNIELGPDGSAADLHFELAPGPQVRVGQVLVQIEDPVRTNEKLVRATLKLRSGAILDPETLFESQRSLVLLGIFKQVAVRMIDPDAEESPKDIAVELKEAPRISGEAGVGYFLVDGPRVLGDVVVPNIGGQGINVALRGRVNYAGGSLQAVQEGVARERQGFDGLGGRGNLTVAYPRIYNLLPVEVGARLDLIAERIFRPTFSYTRLAAVAGLDWAAARWLNAGLQYEIEYDHVTFGGSVERLLNSLNKVDQERVRFGAGYFPLQTLRPNVTIDFRDDPANPRSGTLLSFTGEATRDVNGAQLTKVVNGVEVDDGDKFKIFTIKVAGTITHYVPLWSRATLALSLRGGRFFFPDPRYTVTVAPKRFFLGGSSTLRGFREDGVIPEDRRDTLHRELRDCQALGNPSGCTADSLALRSGREVPSEGGELFTLGKAELRFPVFGGFDLGLFAEAGNLWFSAAEYNPLRLRYVAGFGIRYPTPIGPLAFDLGANLIPDTEVNEQNGVIPLPPPLQSWIAFNINFSIGLF